MFALRVFGRGLRQHAAPLQHDSGQPDLIAHRISGGMLPDLFPIQYAVLAWNAEQRGDLNQAFSVYELLAQRETCPRWIQERLAAVCVALGRYPLAITTYESLSVYDPEDAPTLMALAHLFSLDGRNAEACNELERAVALLSQEGEMTTLESEVMLECLQGAGDDGTPERPGVTQVQTLTRRGLNYLQRGRFVRATELFEEAMNRVDSLLIAHGQWLLAQSRVDGGELAEHLAESLISLAQLSDSLLQHLARTKLAGNVAAALREKRLRHDLASWATGCHEVQSLLKTEQARLRELSAAHPNHAELFYRIGLCNRATGDYQTAAKAFQRVLVIEPHHAKSGVRLAATLLQLKRSQSVLAALESTFALQPSDARQYHALAVASTDSEKFDRAVTSLARDLGAGFAAGDAKANLAFALGMLGVKDAEKDGWREPGKRKMQNAV